MITQAHSLKEESRLCKLKMDIKIVFIPYLKAKLHLIIRIDNNFIRMMTIVHLILISNLCFHQQNLNSKIIQALNGRSKQLD